MSKKEKLQGEIKESAQKIWLAGLGALAIAEEEGSKIFRNLVEKGEKFESVARERVSDLKGKVDEGKEKVESQFDKIEEMVNHNMASFLGKMGVPTREEINQLSSKVEELMGLIQKLKAEESTAPAVKETKESKGRNRKVEEAE
jgi:poly(hydroxyalkanoate) granule-associated protein